MFSKIKELLWRRKYIFLFVGLFLIVLTQRFLNERQNGLINSVSSDGLGYYCYLPAAIIYQDFTYSYYNDDKNNIKPFYRPVINPYKDKGVNKYYCGTAVCLLPFFMAGIVVSAIAGTDINGYTDTFLMLVSVAALFYYLLSIFLLTKVAKFFGVSEQICFGVCLIFFFGTNMFHYVIQEPSMSHAYSFFAVSLFLYCYMRLNEHVSTKNLIFLGLSLGLVALVRPVNVLVVLFTPFFSQNIKQYFILLKEILVNHFRGVLSFVFVIGLSVMLQFTFYYFQTGDFYIVSYEGETFNFSKPEIFNTLFSYRKGLFIYVPILLFALIFILCIKNNWFKKAVFFITVSMFIYVTASWWCWWYGGGLSIRPVIDFLPVFIVTCMLLFSKLSVGLRKVVLISCAPFVFLSQFMAFQYSNRIMDTSYMNEEKFWDIFLESDLATINEKRIRAILVKNKVVKMEVLNYELDGLDSRVTDGGYQSQKASVVGEKNHYSKGFGFPIKDLNVQGSFYFIVECMAKTTKEGKDLGLVVSIDENPKIVLWEVVFFNQFGKEKDGWTKMTQIVEIDEALNNKESYVKIFANTEKGENLVDDLKYSVVKK